MDSEKIILPAFQIAEMYRNYLVDLPDNRNEEQQLLPQDKKILSPNPKKAADISFSGQNGKQILVLVRELKEQHINKPDLTFLVNILKACQLTIEDIAIVNTAKQQADFKDFQTFLKPKFVLCFGVSLEVLQLGFDLPVLQISKQDNVIFINSPALGEMNNQTQQAKVLKSKLWVTLKEAFGV